MPGSEFHDERGRFKKGVPPGPGWRGVDPLHRGNYSRRHMQKVLKEEGLDPFRELVRLLPHLSPEKQADALLKIFTLASGREVNQAEKQPKNAGPRSPMDLGAASQEELEAIVHGNPPEAATIQGNQHEVDASSD